MPVLTFISGPRRGTEFYFEDEVTVGRGEGADLDIADPTASRRHLRIHRLGRRFMAADLGSGNGTLLNGVRLVLPAPLVDGDRLAIGTTRLAFQATSHRRRALENVSLKDRGFDPSTSMDYDPDAIPELLGTAEPLGTARQGLQDKELLHRRLAFLRDVGSLLAETVDEQHLLSTILDRIVASMPEVDRVLVVVRDGETGEYLPRAAKMREAREGKIETSRELLRRTIEQRQAILTTAPDSRSVICLPLVASNELLGALQVDGLVGHEPFDEMDLATFSSVAAALAQALANAWLHDQLLDRRMRDYDLALARRIQRQFLPDALPEITSYDFAACYLPALEVGGDLYDARQLTNGHLRMAVGDVSGKGVSGALLMARIMTDLRYSAGSSTPPLEVLERINGDLGESGNAEMFVTMLYLDIDPVRNRVEIVNAGHLPPLLLSAGSSVTKVEVASGLPLGLQETAELATSQLTMNVGETLVLYSDGLVESVASSGSRLGLEGLLGIVRDAPRDPQQLVDHIVDAVDRLVGDQVQADDLTIVCLSRTA